MKNQNQKPTPILCSIVSMPDNMNPNLIFQGTESALLSRIVKGEINIKALAKQELQSRFCNIDGEWVGPKASMSKEAWIKNLPKTVLV